MNAVTPTYSILVKELSATQKPRFCVVLFFHTTTTEDVMETKTAFLNGKLVSLRPVNENDADTLVRWINDPEVTHFISSGVFPNSHAQEVSWIRGLDDKKDNLVLVIETAKGIPIGTVGLHRINWVDRTGTTGALIGEKEYWGKGYGTEAKILLLHHAFTRMNLRTISSSVIAFNERSYRALRKQGYVEVGRMPKWHYRDGKYHDQIMLILTKQAFMRKWNIFKTSLV